MRPPKKSGPSDTAQRHPALAYRPPFALVAAKGAAAVLALLILLGGAYVGLWFYAAGLARDAVTDWADAHRRTGATVAYERLDIGGFPFHLRLVAARPALAFPGAGIPWSWAAESLLVEMRPWDFQNLAFRAPGRHALAWTAGDGRRMADVRAGALSGTARLSGGRLVSAALEAAAAEVTGGGLAGPLVLGRLALDVGLSPAADPADGTPAATLRLSVRDARVPSPAPLPLGPDVAAFDLDARVLGDIRGLGAEPLADTLARWRDAGGTIEAESLGLAYGPLALAADGTLALDAGLQPIGAFTARIEGFFEALDALGRNGLVGARDAVTAKMVLGVLAKRNEAGRFTLTVPLTLQDRRLFAGPVPLLAVPRVDWPAIPGR